MWASTTNSVGRASLALAALMIAPAVLAATSATGTRLDALPQAWTEDSGKPLSLVQLEGRPVIVTMAYANCHRICPMTIDQLKRIQAVYDTRHEVVAIVVVGYDPENEDAATWRQYRKSHGLSRTNWHFVTGSLEDTTRFARQLNFELWKYDEHVMHDSHVLYFDSTGVLARELESDAPDAP